MKNTWVIIVVVVLVLIGGYLGRHKIKALFSGSSAPASVQTQTPGPSVSPTPSASSSPMSDGVVTTETGSKGSYLADQKGMTLYVYDKDTAGVSNCSGGCAKVWHPYVVSGTAPSTLPTNITTIKRADGTMQYAYKGKPLYYYATDTKPGDTTGDGIGGVWHLVKP